MRVLLYGSTGWIGSKLLNLLQAKSFSSRKSIEVVPAKTRLENYSQLEKEIDEVQPTHVLNCAGLTGRPNVDWCEDHRIETLQVNVIGCSLLADLCSRKGIHFTYVATGCIYEYDKNHLLEGTEYNGPGFKEEDDPNFDKSFYSYSKILTEKIVKEFPQTLVLRVRMPLSDDLNPRNFITKITKYAKVVNIPNSMTVLHDLLPLIPDMMEKRKVGIWNFCNPGTINHNQILDLYKYYIDPKFTYENFSVEEQSKVIKAGRSNNSLDVSKLLKEYPDVLHINDAIIHLFRRMRVHLDIQKIW